MSLSSETAKYKLLEVIGGGSFGQVYKALNEKEKEVAIKVLCYTAFKKRNQSFQNEVHALKALSTSGRTPKLLDWGHKEKTEELFIVLELFSEDLETFIFYRSPKLERKLIISKIAEEALLCLQAVHKSGFLHMDIKPSNFLIRNPLRSNPSLVISDFGLAIKYRNPDGSHCEPCRKVSGLRGSLQFASINCLDLKAPSRRDDIESLGWMLLFLHQEGHLLQGEINDARGASRYKKHLIKEARNLKCWRGFSELIDFMGIVGQLGFYDEPDYDQLINIISSDKKKKMELSSECDSKQKTAGSTVNSATSMACFEGLIKFTEREQWMNEQDDEGPVSNLNFLEENSKFNFFKD